MGSRWLTAAVSDNALSLPGVTVRGLMTMAAFVEDPQTARPRS